MLMEIWDLGDEYQYYYPNGAELSIEDVVSCVIGFVESFKTDNVPEEDWDEIDEYVQDAINDYYGADR